MDRNLHGNDSPAAWQVAAKLRWTIVRGVLIDPISWLLIGASAWGLHRFAGGISQPGTLGASLLILTVLSGAVVFASIYADRLLFLEAENDFLRAQPLGELGFYRLRSVELSWWLRAPAVLAGAAGLGASGWWLAILSAATVLALSALGLGLSLILRGPLRQLRSAVRILGLGLPALALYLFGGQSIPATATPLEAWLPACAAFALLSAALAARVLAPTLFRRQFDELSSLAAVRDRSDTGRFWSTLNACLPLPLPLRARLSRDLVLLARGWDARGALLLLLSPLSCLYLAEALSGSMREAAVLWRSLEAAALGAAAIAYAVGPNIHILRADTMVWSRTAPNPGRNELRSALLYAALFATMHGTLILGTVATVRDGRFADQLLVLAGPVLALEIFMVHFAVVFSMAESLGRRVAGEGALILALACVGAGLAVIAILYPLALPLYLIFTLGLAGRARERYERLEVTW